MHVFGEAIDHHQDNRFLARLRESLDEVHVYVLPHRSGDVEWLEEAGRVQVLSLVSLANRATTNEVADEAAVVQRKECGAQSMKSLLDTLMAHAMCLEQEGRPGR
jgi:hypothetical protein